MPYAGGPPAGVQPAVFVPDGALDAWYASRGQAGQEIVAVAGIGDSILRGHYATARSNAHFWARLVAALQAKYGGAGEGFKPVSDTLDNAYTYASFSAVAEPCWTFTPAGAWNQYGATYGVGGQAHQSPAGSGVAAGLFSGTGVDLIGLRQPGGGPYTVSIDGVPYDAYGAPNGAGGDASAYAAVATSPATLFSARGLARGRHTVTAGPRAGLLWLHGLVAYDGVGRGILPYNMAYSGKSAYQMLLNTRVDSAKASVAGWAIPLKLVIVEHIVNDMQQGVAFDTYEALSRRLCDAAKMAGASILFVIPFAGPMAGAWANVGTAHAYIDRVYNLARRHGAAVLDVNAAWEALGPAAAASFIGNGDAHPVDAGHRDIAARLIGLLV
jgi:hypothetical protein